MIGGRLRERLSRGEAVTMVNPNHVSPSLVARLCEAGADTVFLDCEHGSWGWEEVRTACLAARAGGQGAIVRPRSHDRSLLIRYLNCGADGLMAPMVSTPAQASAVVDAVRYAYPETFGERLVVTMVETVEAIANIEAIAAVEGIDAMFVGPADLSQSMGYSPYLKRGEKRPAPVIEAVENAISRICAAGRIAGTLVTGSDLGYWRAAGAQLLYLHAEPFLVDGLEQVRRSLEPR